MAVKVRLPHRRIEKRSTAETPSSVFITGGIGDVLAVTCFVEIRDFAKVFYATQPVADIMPILKLLMPNSGHCDIWHDWKDRHAFYTLEEFQSFTNDQTVLNSEDWSIHTVFKQDLEFRGAPWLWMFDIHKFRLPPEYAVLCPRSIDKREPARDFTSEEIQSVVDWSQRRGIPLVHVYSGPDECPLPASVLNLQNKTHILETMAVVANASWYVGIDSCQSQVATKRLAADRLLIKSINPHYYRSLKWYCCPHKEFPFVVSQITANNLNCLERKHDSWK